MKSTSLLRARLAASSAVIGILLASSLYLGRSAPGGDGLTAAVSNPIRDYEAALSPDLTAIDSTLPQAPSESAPTRLTLPVGDGQTLAGVLGSANVASGDALAAIDALRRTYDPRKLKAGQLVSVDFKRDGGFLGFQMQADGEHLVSVSRNPGGFVAQQIDTPVKTETHAARGVIHNSLFEAAAGAGIPYPITAAMIRAFSYDIDFQREVQPGDRFRVLYDTEVGEGGTRPGDVLFAELVLSGKPHEIYGVRRDDGTLDFFTRDGKSVKKGLLKTPIDGARLTSGFGMRMHPLLGFTRMHKGVDFGAPTGTPIFAAGEGVVEFSGWAGGYGHFIKLRHSPHMETAYGHMSRLAVAVGRHVHQGEIIGYVGMTGDATGPHLHYEVIKDGVQVNPINVTVPVESGLQGIDMVAFLKKAKDREDQFATLIDTKQFAQASAQAETQTK